MATTTAEPYRAYTPRPFTRAERDSVTILFGGLHWRLERLLQAVLENSGYKARILPVATKEDLLTGREVADIGQCCPTSFTTGNLVNFLRAESKAIGAEEVAKRYVYLTAGSCGACRFGQYHQSYELALRNTGLEAFRMFLLAQDQMDQKARDGRRPRPQPARSRFGCLWAIFCADLVQDLEYQVRPYEVEPGPDGRRRAREHGLPLRGLQAAGRSKESWRAVAWHLTTAYFARALREVHRKFATIEVDRLRVKPTVKITGEFYLQTVEGEPNYNIHRWLEAEGAEVYPAAVTVWMDYLLRLGLQRFEDYSGIERGARLKLGAGRAAQAVYRWTFDRLRRALGDLPHELPEPARAPPARRPVLPQPARRRRGRHARREGALGPPEEEGPHDLRAVALLLHAEHDEHRRDGRRRRQVPRPPLRAARDQGRRRGPRPVALPDDPDRGEEARPARVRRRSLERHGPHGRGGARLRGRPPRDAAATYRDPAAGASRRAPPPTWSCTSRSSWAAAIASRALSSGRGAGGSRPEAAPAVAS